MEKKNLQLYKERTFSEKINDTFGFIRDYWRPLLTWNLYLVLPVSLVAAVSTNSVFDVAVNQLTGQADATSLGMQSLGSLLQLVLSVVSMALVFAIVQLSMQRADTLDRLTLDELKTPLLNNVGRIVVLVLSSLLLVIPLVLVALLAGVLVVAFRSVALLGVLLILVFFGLLLPLSLIPPVYLLEDGVPLWDAVTKGYRLGWKTFWGLFALLLVLGIVVMLLSVVFEGPRLAVWFVDLLSAQTDANAYEAPSMMASFGNYLLSVLMVFGGQLVSVVIYLGLIFHYGHAAEHVDGVTVDEQIESFETL